MSAVTEEHQIKYINDLIYAAIMLEKVLDYESKRTGFNLAASSEEAFTGKLIPY